MNEKLKILECIGPLVSERSHNTFYLLHAETANKFGGVWSTIRWTAPTDKAVKVGTEVELRIRKLDVEKGEGSFYV